MWIRSTMASRVAQAQGRGAREALVPRAPQPPLPLPPRSTKTGGIELGIETGTETGTGKGMMGGG
jgi:hypothetical protein